MQDEGDTTDGRGEARGRVLRPQPILDRAVQAEIGVQLRALYGEVLDQPVPQRLVDLIARIEVAPAGGSPEDGSSA